MIGGIREAGLATRTDWRLQEIGRVGDFSEEQLRAFGRRLAERYLANTAEARGV